MSFVSLAALCVALFVLTMVCATVPLHLPISSPSKIDTVSKLASGILLGAALGIVIPEGFNAVSDSQRHRADGATEGDEFWTGISLLSGFALMFLIDLFAPHAHAESQQRKYRHHRKHDPRHARRRSATVMLESDSSADFDHHEVSPLVPLPSPSSASTTMNGGLPPPGGADSAEEQQPQAAAEGATPPYSLVLGLLAHSLADGISLGASGSQSLSAIVFVAIALHKAPTAFALTTLLMAHPGASKWFVRHTIWAFSLSSPVGAIATKALLTFLGHSDERLTGLVLCFSGGSFLYVAAETVKGASGHHHGSPSEQDQSSGTKRGAMLKHAAMTLIGMAMPIILSNLVKGDHGHGH